MTGEVNARFCDLVKSLRPLIGKELSAGKQVAEVISMLTRVPGNRIGTAADPSQASQETLRKMSSDDRSFTKKLANAIYECMDLGQFIIRIDAAAIPVKQRIVDNLAEYGTKVNLDELGERCVKIALTVISRKAGQKLTSESVAAKIAYARGIADNKDALLMQCAGLCMECSASLIADKRGDGIPVYEILPIDPDVSSYGLDDYVVMCPTCAAKYKHHPSKSDIDRVRSEKKAVSKQRDFEGLLTPLSLEKELAKLLDDIRELGFEDTSHQQIQMRNPVPIRDKVSEDGELCREITDSVSSYYPFIAARMKMLEETQRLSFNDLLSQMHAKYLKYEGQGLSQAEIFDHLSDWIADRTHSRSRTASILVSYFVQICEVFRAPAQ
ncbi:ABC-three component system protein [Bifidobacterium aesculapii]|uniref:ABC-three component system protein n=1 Tax=Bifidobacterium aesculapii TaxID=1329411 RepID=UPI0006E18379|nr:ABC-three component system protein [Bifidobacterium aesculapii]